MVERRGIISGDEQEELGEISSWSLPSLDQAGKVIHTASREAKERSKETVESVSRAGRPKQLTAEEIKKISKDAEQEGYKAGYEEGFSKGEIQGEQKGKTQGETRAYAETKARLNDNCNRLESILQTLSLSLEEQEQGLEKTLLDVAFHFACKLIQKEIDEIPESFRQLVASVIQALPAGSKNMTIFLNPEDAQLIQGVLESKHQSWPLQIDDSLMRGGCRVETMESIVDYSIEKRWMSLLENVTAPNDSGKGNNAS